MSNNTWFEVHAPPEGKNFEEMKKICQTSEASGFDLFTLTDHLMNMGNPNGPDNHPLECWTTLAGLAAVTDRIKLGTLVTCYAYRLPTILAKMATTVDIISGGRLIFGIGAGWHEEEFKGFLGRFPPPGERLRGLRETVEICKSMFTQERTTYHGKMYQFDNVLNSPQPVQKPIPILIGGAGEKVTLKIAAEHADISHIVTSDLDTLDHKLSVLEKHCESVGRDYNDIRKGAFVRVGGSAPTVTMDDVVNRIEEYQDRGVGLITFLAHGTASEVNSKVELIAREVLPHFK